MTKLIAWVLIISITGCTSTYRSPGVEIDQVKVDGHTYTANSYEKNSGEININGRPYATGFEYSNGMVVSPEKYNEIDWGSVVGVLGVVLVVGLIFAGGYYSGKSGKTSSAPVIPATNKNGYVEPSNTSTSIPSQKIITPTNTTAAKLPFDKEISARDDNGNRYKGTVDNFGDAVIRDEKGNTLRGTLDQDGNGRVRDKNGNTYRLH